MLSPANMFLLGVIDARPINPYEIVSRFEYNRYKFSLNIADSTIYANIRSMYKNRFVTFEEQQESNMPVKKVYSLTDCGKEELKITVKAYLCGSLLDVNGFSIALLLMHYFSREEILEFLKQHEEILIKTVAQREDDYNFVSWEHSKFPCIPNVVSAFNVYFEVKQELETVRYAMKMLRNATEWPQNTFEADHLYAEAYTKWQEMRK